VLGGVCAALASHLRWPVRVVRVVFVCLAFLGGAGVLLYLWLWALAPLERPTDVASPVSRRVPVAAVLVALTAVAAVTELGAVMSSGTSAADAAVAVAIAFAGGAVAWSLVFDAADPTRSDRYGVLVRTIATFLLLFVGLTALLSRPTVAGAVLGMIAIVFAVAVLAAPRLVALWTTLMAERAARVRQDQRAEIAAHLHDSVLQTLALIQTRAGASSEVARIARAQERELRDWLFADDTPSAEDLATELREIAAVIELDYSARIDVVATGAAVPVASPALVGAAREAMLNAARHAGGDVSVYVESTTTTVDVFIRDRGVGVDLHALPDDRLGIRESIIGRMTRVGGTATVGRGAGGGTEVHLRLERSDD
jgi:signal transduction histidine kinase